MDVRVSVISGVGHDNQIIFSSRNNACGPSRRRNRMFTITPIGHVNSSLVDRQHAPKQGNEGAPQAWLIFKPEFDEGLRDLRVGEEVLVLTWLDRAHRDILSVHPRDDQNAPLRGVFSTRSQDRPNPSRNPSGADRRDCRSHPIQGPRYRGLRRDPRYRRQANPRPRERTLNGLAVKRERIVTLLIQS